MKIQIKKINETFQNAHHISYTFLKIGYTIAMALLLAGFHLFIENSTSPIYFYSVVSSVFETAFSVVLVSFLFFFISDYILKKDT